jgi:tetratricopeptide (TPR) repeat protein
MRKIGEYRAKNGVLIAASLAAVLYGTGCWMVLRAESDLDHAKHPPLETTMMERAQSAVWPHRPVFYRTIADRVQFYPHDPAIVAPLYETAIRKGPADYRNLFAYAYYLVSRNCCPETVLALLNETVRRCPTNPDMHQVAASYYLAISRKDEALPYFRRAIELEPNSAVQLYRLLDQHGADVNTLIGVTPSEPDALIQLARYLHSRTPSKDPAFTQIVVRLSRMNLNSDQQLSAAELALQAGMGEDAHRLALQAAGSSTQKIAAYRLLANQALQAKQIPTYLNFCGEVEKAFLERGDANQAASHALDCAWNAAHSEGNAGGLQNVLDVVNRYPRYAPAYLALARLSEKDSPEASLLYLQKAAVLAPDKVDYQNLLAERYIKASRYGEAENLYRAMLEKPEMLEDAYLGLSAIRMKLEDRFGAIRILEEGVSRSGQSRRMRVQLGALYTSIGDDQKAVTIYLNLINMDPEQADPHALAGIAYLNLGQIENARKQFLEAIALDPNNALAKQGLARIQSLAY